MRELIIFILTLTAMILSIIALCKQQVNEPFYFKIEVQYGK